MKIQVVLGRAGEVSAKERICVSNVRTATNQCDAQKEILVCTSLQPFHLVVVFWLVARCHVMSMSCDVMLSDVMWCHVMSSDVMWYYVMFNGLI